MQKNSLNITGTQSKAVVFCADDFGMNRLIDQGILKLAEQGRLSASSCMSKGTTFFDDAPQLAELPIQKGLHLNLTEAQRETKFFQPLPKLIKSCYLHRIEAALISTEIEEQCDRFEQAFHRPPDYVDGHQHVHQLPVVREALLRILKRRYGSDHIWIRSTRMPSGIPSIGDWLKSKVIESLGGLSLLQLAKADGFRTSHCLLGVYNFSGDAQQYLARLDTWMQQASSSDVFMCHPAFGSDANDPIAHQREVEFAVLSDQSLTDILAKHHVHIAVERSSIN